MTRGLVAAALAVLCHFAFAGLVIFFSFIQLNLPRSKRPPPPRPVALRNLSGEQWAKNRGQTPPKDDRSASKSKEREELAKKKEEKKKEDRPEGQVVDVAPGNRQEDPNAKYLAESSNKVEKETKAREQTPFYRNAMPQRTSNVPQNTQGADDVDRATIAGNKGTGQDDRPLRQSSKLNLEVPNVKRQEEIALRTPENDQGTGLSVSNRKESQEIVGNSNRLNVDLGQSEAEEEGSSEGKQGEPGVANLTPSMSVLDKISGAAPNDHLDADEGEGTFLNTKEWKYSSFFNRVKQSVGMHWNPSRELRVRDPSGTIYGGRDRYTIVNVTLNERGMVKDIYVEKSSGVDFLDMEAIHSFERAQPFPNPPPGLIASDSTVRFSFGFFLEMGGGPRFKLFRQAN